MKLYDVGYITGVFDLFHIGHLNLLRLAKEHCGRLIAGVSTDELVMKYKHKTPFISLHDRMENVKAIRYVDNVVVQSDVDEFKLFADYSRRGGQFFYGMAGIIRTKSFAEEVKSMNAEREMLKYVRPSIIETAFTKLIRLGIAILFMTLAYKKRSA